jgi:predicted metal-dependent peptidase
MSSFAAAITRLSDPKNVSASPRQFKDNAEKISSTITRLFRQPENGGNPFLFALAGPKPHELSDEIPTAATDGKKFYWNPGFLESMNPDQVATVMSHESYHVLFFHCSPERAAGLHGPTWNIAVDYVVNGVIEADHQKSGRVKKIPNLWGGVIGVPVTLDMYIEWIDGKRDDLPQPGCFMDLNQHGRSPESIYDQIRKAQFNSPRRCKEATGGCGAMSIDPKTGQSTLGPGPYKPECCQQCGAEPNQCFGGGSLDSHMPSAQTKDETLGDMMRAADQVKALGRGTVPGDIEAALGRLQNPELSARDIIRLAIAQKVADKGNMNDWKRFRRRPSYIYSRNKDTGKMEPVNRLYTPKKYDFNPKISVMVDTSGSMSDDDIVCGVKELQSVCGIAEIRMTPNDTQPHWDKTIKVSQKSDFTNFRVAGRGGTDFTQYLTELPQQSWYDGCDLVIIITDGDCGTYPKELIPRNADLLWIVTNKRDFKPVGGRVAQLRPARQ